MPLPRRLLPGSQAPGGPALPTIKALLPGPPRTGVKRLARTPETVAIPDAVKQLHTPFCVSSETSRFRKKVDLSQQATFSPSIIYKKTLVVNSQNWFFVLFLAYFFNLHVTNPPFFVQFASHYFPSLNNYILFI